MLKVQDEPEQKLLHGWLFVNTNVCWIRKLFFLFSFLCSFFFFHEYVRTILLIYGFG